MTRAEINAIVADVEHQHLVAMWIEEERTYRCPTCGWEVEDEFGATHGYNETVALLTGAATCWHDTSSALYMVGYIVGDAIPCGRAAAYNDTIFGLCSLPDDGGDGDREGGGR